jgi:hypothetical protein
MMANPESDSSCGATGLLGWQHLHGVEVGVVVRKMMAESDSVPTRMAEE